MVHSRLIPVRQSSLAAALFLISAYFIAQADGNNAAQGLKTLSLTIQLAYDIGLDRDPDELDERYTVIEGE